MKMDKVASSRNDEFYTPRYAIRPIIQHIRMRFKEGARIWCPFDTEQSRFVELLREEGFTVHHSHIDDGGDFFSLVHSVEADLIISNPPYSRKTEVLEALFKQGVPFAMLVGVAGLFESERRFSLFEASKFEIMMFNRRVSYLRSYEDDKPALNPPFSSVYITHRVLREPFVFERINKKDV
jgi:hypothetical protein